MDHRLQSRLGFRQSDYNLIHIGHVLRVPDGRPGPLLTDSLCFVLTCSTSQWEGLYWPITVLDYCSLSEQSDVKWREKLTLSDCYRTDFVSKSNKNQDWKTVNRSDCLSVNCGQHRSKMERNELRKWLVNDFITCRWF